MMLRPRMLKTLLGKEFLRLRKNPGALMLLGLLVTIALLVSLSWKDAPPDNQERTCWIVYSDSWTNSGWIDYLNEYHPTNPLIKVVTREKLVGDSGELDIPSNDCAIELPPYESGSNSRIRSKVVYHFPAEKYEAITPAAAWFWATWKQFSSNDVYHDIDLKPYAQAEQANMASMIRTSAAKNMNIELIATMLLLSVQFFTCCHLYVSFSSQDRERGTLSALALSPVSVFEMLIARFIFHLTLGLSVSALILFIVNRSTSISPSIFLVLVCVGTAWLCVGKIIAALTKTQAQASMLMFCYMLGGGILFYLSSQFPIFRSIQLATFENHAVTLLHQSIETGQLLALPAVILVILTGVWALAATSLFERIGWQS